MKTDTLTAVDEQLIPQLSEAYYLLFRELVLEVSGLYFPEKKRLSLEAGVLRSFREASQALDLDSYYRMLRRGDYPAELERLINALTVNETYFFRDEAQFKALREQILPALITRKRAIAAAIGPGIQPQLRIWCAGCASGEEPYSVAMLLKELLPDLATWQILILGTDINRETLASAQQASYSDWSFREAQAKLVQPVYFTFEPGARRYQVVEEIRSMVHFAPLNLVRNEFPAISNNTTNMDLILCRNVTIYFTSQTTQQVINGFYEALVEEGWLVVGHAEPSQEIYQAFQTHLFPGTLVYQKRRLGQEQPVSLNGQGLAPATEMKLSPAPASAVEVTPALPKANEPSAENPDLGRAAGNEGSSLDRPPAGRDCVAVARQLLNEGQVEAAITMLAQQVAITPDVAALYALLCQAYANIGNWEEARRWGQKALKLDNLLSEVYYTLALVYEHQQQPEAAIAMLKKVIYLDWEAPLPHFQLAMLYQEIGRPDEARQSWQKVVALLNKWPPAKIVPDSGGETAQNLLRTAQRLMEMVR
jgi:chemotaxis protein methyltransferase CheR